MPKLPGKLGFVKAVEPFVGFGDCQDHTCRCTHTRTRTRTRNVTSGGLHVLQQAANESKADLEAALAGTDMVFVTVRAVSALTCAP